MEQTLNTFDEQVNEYICHQQSTQREICQEVRKIIFETFPDIKEKMKWGVPSYDSGRYYIVALKDHVNLGFSIKGLSTEEIALFDDGGKTMKHIQVRSLEDINKKKIIKLLKMVQNKSNKTT